MASSTANDAMAEDINERMATSLGGLPLTAVTMSVGVLLVAYAFARGRVGESWSQPFYWVGLLFVAVPPAIALLRVKSVTYREALGIVVLIALSTYAIKECYSPLQFTFSDEFQHLPTAQSILSSHHLFHTNPELPSSPYYPSLEILASIISLTTHLSIYGSAVVLLATLHLLTAVGLFFLSYAILPNTKIAALSVLIYSTGGDFLVFNSYFSYQSVGLPLTIITLLAFVRMLNSSSRQRRLGWTIATLSFGAVTVVSHHVSSYLLLLLICCLAIASFVNRPTRRQSMVPAIVVLSLAAMTAVWDLAIARPTRSYLSAAFSGLLSPTPQAIKGNLKLLNISGTPIFSQRLAGESIPFGDSLLEYGWAILISALLISGLVIAHRRRTMLPPLAAGWAFASMSIFAAFAIKVISPVGGGELSTRVLSFTLIPGCFFCAIGIESFNRLAVEYPRSTYSPRFNGIVVGVNSAIAIVILALLEPGGIASGWPPYYGRIPGPYLVAGRMRTINSYDVETAVWAREHLPKGSKIATDLADAQLMDSIGGMQASDSVDISFLFVSTSITPELSATIKKMGIEYVAVDTQIASGIAIAGLPVFENDPFSGHYRRPIPRASLNKFNSLANVSRIYSSGPMVIYKLGVASRA